MNLFPNASVFYTQRLNDSCPRDWACTVTMDLVLILATGQAIDSSKKYNGSDDAQPGNCLETQ